MRNTKSGFTLVELIVVITILAILGTIAFISLGSYTADARNAKRLDGVSKLAEAVNNDQLNGISLLAYVTGDAANNSVAISVSGTGTTVGNNYQAGDINATALKVNAEQYKDPSQDELYKMGVTTKKGGAFEFSAKLEDGGARTSLVKGTYINRTTAAKAILATATGSTTVTLDGIDAVNFFKVGDLVNTDGTGATTYTISNISNDGQTISITPGIVALDALDVVLQLNADESIGLISSTGSLGGGADGIITNESATIFPY